MTCPDAFTPAGPPPEGCEARLKPAGNEKHTEAAAVEEQAGLQIRVISHPSGWMTQEQQRDRVNL
jgi:hypothetical protein